jgi:uncharacterized protein (DUF305 family)
MLSAPSSRRGVRRAALVAAVALGLLSGATSQAWASEPAREQDTARFETSFLTETIDHHYMGVLMGRLCMDKARSRRLGDVCTAIVVNQGEEIARMRDDFLLDWYDVEKHATLMPSDRNDLRELARERGAAFDIALSRMFIEHHTVQIGRSRECVEQAEHHKLKHVCMDQIDTQSQEIRQFRRILRSYGRS